MKNSEQLFESVKKGLINENYIDLKPVNNLEPTPSIHLQ